MSHHARLAALTVGACLAITGVASAAPAVSNVTAAPANPAAGANSDFTVAFDLTGLGPAGTGGDDIKSLQIDLPPGLVGNPLATGTTCAKAQLQADACPDGTKVGTTTVQADALAAGLIDLGEQTIPGDIYNEATAGSEAARLGIVLRPALGLPKVIQESPVVLRAADGGLTSTLDNIANTSTSPAGDIELRIDRMSLTLNGKLASGKGFMNNPTSCAPAQSVVTIGTYAKQTASGTATFTPTACDALPFAPQLSATVGTSRDELRPGAHPAMIVTVTQEAGEANAKSVAVTLPPGIGANLLALNSACPLATFQAGSCPAAAVVGSGAAYSPLLSAPLTGPVTLVSDPAATLPQLRVGLRGVFSVDLIGNVSFGAAGRLVNTFDGIYDVPLSRFVLTVDAGAGSPLGVDSDLCLPGAAALEGTFTAHSGKQATASAVAQTVGCDKVRASKLRARVSRLRTGRPALRLKVSNADRGVTALTVRLPKGLILTSRAKALTSVVLTGVGVSAKVAVRHGRLAVTIAHGGSGKVDVRLAKGALRVSKTLRRAKHPKLKLAVDVRLAGRPVRHTTVRLPVVAKV